MKFMLLFLLVVFLAGVSHAQDKTTEEPDESKHKDSWWDGFKTRVKTVLTRWRDDIKQVWEEVLAKADDMKGWTTEVFDSFKKKIQEWVEKQPEVPDTEKNEIENFISKLKFSTEKPLDQPKFIEP